MSNRTPWTLMASKYVEADLASAVRALESMTEDKSVAGGKAGLFTGQETRLPQDPPGAEAPGLFT